MVQIALADRPYISAQFGDYPNEHIQVQSVDQTKYLLSRSLFPVFSVTAVNGYVLPPGDAQLACNVVVEVPVDRPRSFQLELVVGAVGSEPHRFALRAEKDRVAEAIRSALQGRGTDLSDLVVIDPPFGSDQWD